MTERETETFYGKPVRWMVMINNQPAEVVEEILCFASSRSGPTLFRHRVDVRKVIKANEKRDNENGERGFTYEAIPLRIEDVR